MTLIVETGAVIAGAESYLSVVDATAYHLARGNDPWALLTETHCEEALRRATDYMVQVYRQRWKGYRKDKNQALDWPRCYVYLEPYLIGAEQPNPYLVSDTIVPVEVKNACAELALRSAAEDLYPDQERQAISKTVGPISVTYDQASPYAKQFRSIDAMLAPYLAGSGLFAKVIRT